MFGQLLESRARRARRTGGAALSVAVHTAIIGAAVALTTHGKPDQRVPIEVVTLRMIPPVTPDLARTPVVHVPLHVRGPYFTMRTIDAPVVTPPSLPPIEASAGLSLDSILISSGGSGRGGVGPGSALGLVVDEPPSSGAWTGKELLMRIVSSAKPRYPESLRQAGIGGRVLVRFTVDTLGRIDMGTVQVLESTHDMFARSVRDALPLFRFKPSEVGGHRVRSLAEMPFEFQVTR
jgi:protein TonB